MPDVRLTSNVCLQVGGAPGVIKTRTGAPGDLLTGLPEGQAAFLVQMHMGVIEGGASRPMRVSVLGEYEGLPKRGSMKIRRR